MIIADWRNLLHLSLGKRSSSSLTFSLRYCKLIVLGTLGMPGYVIPKWYYQLVENFRLICRQKINFTPPPPNAFLGILQRYANVFWVLWACLIAHTQNDSISLLKTLMFTKNTPHHSLLSWDITFYRIPQFNWLTAFWPIIREPEFCQIWDWWWNINNNISFHWKTNDEIFQTRKPYFGPFSPKFGQKCIFLEKKALSVFRYSNYLPSCQKSETTIEPFLRKTNELTDGKTGDIISVGETRSLTHFQSMFHFYTLWKHHKTEGFLMFSEDIEVEHWLKMGYLLTKSDSHRKIRSQPSSWTSSWEDETFYHRLGGYQKFSLKVHLFTSK